MVTFATQTDPSPVAIDCNPYCLAPASPADDLTDSCFMVTSATQTDPSPLAAIDSAELSRVAAIDCNAHGLAPPSPADGLRKRSRKKRGKAQDKVHEVADFTSGALCSAPSSPADSSRERGTKTRQDTADVDVADAPAGPVVVEASTGSTLQGEWCNICVLSLLYFLQGLPMGLSAVMPMMLKERGASFSDVGTFSLNVWPFSLKLLWAPIVDTIYIPSVGRRKTWVVLSQLLIGATLTALSSVVDSWLYAEKPAILPLTACFFLLHFLCATQDIAVDGWALTMLRPDNVGWAATCSAFGHTAGYACGYAGYVILAGSRLVTLASFLLHAGMAFIVVTILVGCLKQEGPVRPEHEPGDIGASYRHMFCVLSLPPLRLLIVVLLTWGIAFPITDVIVPVKLQEYGVPKEHLWYMMSALMPVSILLPLIASKWTSRKRPMDLALRTFPLRVLLGPVTAAVVYCTPPVVDPPPYRFYGVLVVVCFVGTVAREFIFVAQQSFFARISDPAMGGSYMSLLSTIASIGSAWPAPLMFYLVDLFTCQEAHSCDYYQTDGFYIVLGLSTVVGVLWYLVGVHVVNLLQLQQLKDWHVCK